MEHGIVQDWNDMEQIWQYIYSKDQLQTFAEEVCMSTFKIFLCCFLNQELETCDGFGRYCNCEIVIKL